MIAWVASLANQMGISLTEAVQRYANGCPRCSSLAIERVPSATRINLGAAEAPLDVEAVREPTQPEYAQPADAQ